MINDTQSENNGQSTQHNQTSLVDAYRKSYLHYEWKLSILHFQQNGEDTHVESHEQLVVIDE